MTRDLGAYNGKKQTEYAGVETQAEAEDNISSSTAPKAKQNFPSTLASDPEIAKSIHRGDHHTYTKADTAPQARKEKRTTTRVHNPSAFGL